MRHWRLIATLVVSLCALSGLLLFRLHDSTTARRVMLEKLRHRIHNNWILFADNDVLEFRIMVLNLERRSIWQLTSFKLGSFTSRRIDAVVPLGAPAQEVGVSLLDRWYRVDLETRGKSPLDLPAPLTQNRVIDIAWSADRSIGMAVDREGGLWGWREETKSAMFVRRNVSRIWAGAEHKFLVLTEEGKVQEISIRMADNVSAASIYIGKGVSSIDGRESRIVFVKGRGAWLADLTSGTAPRKLPIRAAVTEVLMMDKDLLVVCTGIGKTSDVSLYDIAADREYTVARHSGPCNLYRCVKPSTALAQEVPDDVEASPAWGWR